ncbi:MAG: hypothetical protein M5T61_03625 [Acidimicrobiia bacterium]|nr:hypothetical protein [Acidimicrobiia bacterium]
MGGVPCGGRDTRRARRNRLRRGVPRRLHSAATPDLDCADVTERRFTVVAPDPHRFDADGNGLGCESP